MFFFPIALNRLLAAIWPSHSKLHVFSALATILAQVKFNTSSWNLLSPAPKGSVQNAPLPRRQPQSLGFTAKTLHPAAKALSLIFGNHLLCGMARIRHQLEQLTDREQDLASSQAPRVFCVIDGTRGTGSCREFAEIVAAWPRWGF